MLIVMFGNVTINNFISFAFLDINLNYEKINNTKACYKKL